jgi:hypothetical protein
VGVGRLLSEHHPCVKAATGGGAEDGDASPASLTTGSQYGLFAKADIQRLTVIGGPSPLREVKHP